MKPTLSTTAAFSLVEMLMALLVASLLMVAMAPVMTKKFNENVTVSGTNQKKSTIEKSEIFDNPDKNGTDDYKFKIPSNAINVRITMIGAGGAGGGATFGAKLISADETNWTVPEGVTKLRVYMVGGGGGGGTGNVTTTYQSGTINEGYYDYKDGSQGGGGEFKDQKISDLIFKNLTAANYKSGYSVPTVDSKCSKSRFGSWELSATSLVTKITACGAGGADGGGIWGGRYSGGGSGAYDTKDITLPNNYIIRVPGYATHGGTFGSPATPNAGYSSGSGGSGGGPFRPCSNPARVPGTAGEHGGQGGYGANTLCYANTSTAGGDGEGTLYSYGGDGSSKNGGRGGYWGGGGGGGTTGCNRGGGGGGGPAVVMNSSNSVLMIVSGGGGAGGNFWCSSFYVGGGGGGGGPHGGGGGVGNGYGECTKKVGGAGGGNGSAGLGCMLCESGSCYCGTPPCYMGSGGGGGGWPNGVSGTNAVYNGGEDSIAQSGKAGILSTNVFGANYCNGGGEGAGTQNGKPGAVRIEWNSIAGAIRCKYNQTSVGGSGGGAGQVWIGEINVTPNQRINFKVGQGGKGGTIDPNSQSNDSYAGTAGGETYIQIVGGNKYSVSGGGAGSGTNGTTASGAGGGKLTTGWNDWTGKNSSVTGGVAGYKSTNANGAKGGAVSWLDGTTREGASAVSGETVGNDAVNFGTGGSGGGGVVTAGNLPKKGGDGRGGFIYIEWGDSNGGGGSSGEIMERRHILTARAGATVEVNVGRGGIAPDIEIDSDTSYKKGADGPDGEPTKIKVGGSTYTVKGGKGGEAGKPNKYEHGLGGVLDLTGSGSDAKTYPGVQGITGYGGTGGTSAYNLAADGEGLGGCGGNMVAGKCANTTGSAEGKSGVIGGGGGGGGATSIVDGRIKPSKGGNGANGLVIIEWEEYMAE